MPNKLTLTCGHCVKLNVTVYAGRSEMRKNYEVIRLIQDAFARVIPQFPICKKRHDYATVMLSMNPNINSNIDREI